MRTLLMTVLFGLIGAHLQGDVLYDANLGTLPQAQGFVYSGDNGNPSPSVVGGLLLENTTAGDQFWSASQAFDFSGHITMQARLLVNSSNEIPNVGTGTREGYYFQLRNGGGDEFDIGLADTGFNINTIAVPDHKLTKYPIAGSFHNYELNLDGEVGAFFIDGRLQVGGIAPYKTGLSGFTAQDFGGGAGASRSNTELSFFCVTTSTSCAPTAAAVPEPSSVLLLASALLVGLLHVRRRVMARRTAECKVT